MSRCWSRDDVSRGSLSIRSWCCSESMLFFQFIPDTVNVNPRSLPDCLSSPSSLPSPWTAPVLLDRSHPEQMRGDSEVRKVTIYKRKAPILQIIFCFYVLETILSPHQGYQIFAWVLPHLLYSMPGKNEFHSGKQLRNLLKFCPVQKAIFILVKLLKGGLHSALPEMFKH